MAAFAERLASARLIQAVWRGHAVRRIHRPQILSALRRKREVAAASVIEKVLVLSSSQLNGRLWAQRCWLRFRMELCTTSAWRLAVI